MSKELESRFIRQAFEILNSIRGNPQSIEERKQMTIEMASLLLKESLKGQKRKEKRAQKRLAKMMQDPNGKAFTTALTDECFRAKSHKRIANQLIHLLEQFGIPMYLSLPQRLGFKIFKLLGPSLAKYLVFFVTFSIRKQTANVILPAEHEKLIEHIKKRKEEGVLLNLNHLGEAILGEEEAKKRLQLYLDDLKQEEIDYVSIKISTIFSQINLLAWDYSIQKIAEKLRRLYRTAMDHPKKIDNGMEDYKFVNLDMEEHHDLHLTVAVFQSVLNEPEFFNLSAGIVLQAYLPESYQIQKHLTEWAKDRVKNGGAPIKIRIVKGANLASEQVKASLHGWAQTPFTTKEEVDANYKRMLIYGCIPENARAARLGIASHNLFDISFALLLRAEHQVESYTQFEMLEGMADHIRRAVQKITGEILLYCPVAKKEDFQHAIAYLIRRLDENTGEENFLRHLFGLKPGTDPWEEQASFFSESCDLIETLSDHPRQAQDRSKPLKKLELFSPFENDPPTDFSIPENRAWAEKIIQTYKEFQPKPIPLVIGGETIEDHLEGTGYNPSNPKNPLYHYSLAKKDLIHKAINEAKSFEAEWSQTSIDKRCELLANISQLYKEHRNDLLGLMMIDGGKIFFESDPEISEAIDMAEYYYRQMKHFSKKKDLLFQPKGTVLVTPPWNFPCAIPTGGILAGLIAGNCVLFKPAPQAVLTGWKLVNLMWEAGVPKKALQFINCKDEPEGSFLIQDERINTVLLTGGTATAKSFLSMKPDLDLAAETGGKNCMIITSLSDRDLVIKDLIHSAFSHAGQKCSATSLAIIEKQVYDDLSFQRQLKDATLSLKVGPATDLSTKVPPLIESPNPTLLKGLTELEEKESWLVEPKQDPDNPNLYSPGIKLDVKPNSFMHQTELFGPVLGLMRAENLDHAISLANATAYGLTAGLHSLDLREHYKWKHSIEAGNCYINRTTTGAIVQRQPFGGYKHSSFGSGWKAGGPNYILNCMHIKQVHIPKEKQPVNNWVNNLTSFLENLDLSAEELGMWYASVSNYSYWWRRMRHDRDPTKIIGQDNYFRYLPIKNISLRIHKEDSPFDILRICAAALTCSCPLEVSFHSKELNNQELNWLDLVPILKVVNELETTFLSRVRSGKLDRVRTLSKPNISLFEAASKAKCHICYNPVLANGRFELLHYTRELSVSTDYHRYGNLGLRETELRKPIT